MSYKSIGEVATTSVVAISLVGCAATQTAINKRNLEVQTKMSETIFLTPAGSDSKTAFVQIKNTSDKQELDINKNVIAAIESKGYKIVTNPNDAKYWIQGNVLQVGQSDLRAANEALNHGYGATLSGATVGGLIGSLTGNSGDSVLVGGLLGAGIATVGNALVKDVSYSIITDIQISERHEGSAITESAQSKLKQGTGASVEQSSTTISDMKKYQTRILSTANKVNLKFEEAAPELVAGLSSSIAGLM